MSEQSQTTETTETTEATELTLAELERHLWGAADLLRGSIDSGDFKHYIFGLLFYKRLCDVWDEEYEALLAEFDGDAEVAIDPDEHRFHIPADCRWSDIRKISVDIGTQLNMGFRAIEDANPRLKGVFQDVDFANKERFPDAMLESLLQHFDKHRMRKVDVPSTVLGDAYEYLIAKFADDAGKQGRRVLHAQAGREVDGGDTAAGEGHDGLRPHLRIRRYVARSGSHGYRTLSQSRSRRVGGVTQRSDTCESWASFRMLSACSGDGIPNNPNTVLPIAMQAAQQQIPIAVLGLGLEFDETLMGEIARQSGGVYEFVEDPARVALVFREQVIRLEQLVARQMVLTAT